MEIPQEISASPLSIRDFGMTDKFCTLHSALCTLHQLLKHSRTSRFGTLNSYCSLFLRIRYDKNNYQLFLSAHILHFY